MTTKTVKRLLKGVPLRPLFGEKDKFTKNGFIISVDTDKKTIRIQTDIACRYQENFILPLKFLKKLIRKKYLIILVP